MPTNLTPAVVSRNGTGATPWSAVDATGNDVQGNDGSVFVEVNNQQGGGVLTVTADAPFACDHGAQHDLNFTVGTGDGRVLGPFPVAVFGSVIPLRYSGISGSVFVRAFKPATS